MHYRKEIDGLRALAIIPVILFHAGFSTFSGGFVGVDIFFVISGYLITSILLADMQSDRFSLINFYERRARRILPALFFIMAVCIPFAWSWLIPEDFKSFSQSLIAVVGFVSNIFFWLKSGYFQTAAELNPLLHTWSLAVEEQYYLFFPLFLLFVWPLGKKYILMLIAGIFLISLAMAEWGSIAKPSASFYLLPTRCWELLVGAFTAFWLTYKSDYVINRAIRELAGLVGFGFILFAILIFDAQTRIPGLWGLVPVIGTALIILFANNTTFIGNLLSKKIFVGIGLISYSAYLWHQPLFSFAKHRSFGEPSQSVFVFLIVLTLVLAVFTWKYIEAPFRDKHLFKRNQIYIISLLGAVILVTVGLIGQFNNGFEMRYTLPPSVSHSLQVSEHSDTCFDKSQVHIREDWYCDLGNSQKEATFIAFGDSHALSLYDTFNNSAKNIDMRGIFTGASGCIPFLGVYALRSDQFERNCYLLNQRVFDFAKNSKIDKVFLIARWNYYTDGGYSGEDFSYISTNSNDKYSKITSRKSFSIGLQKTVQAYKEAGIKLYIVAQIPEQLYKAKRVYYMLYNDQEHFEEELKSVSVPFSKHQKLQSFVMNLFQPLDQVRDIKLLNFEKTYCTDEVCLIGTSKMSYYLDNNHLSSAGEALLDNIFVNYINE